jgi:hypothetical protein
MDLRPNSRASYERRPVGKDLAYRRSACSIACYAGRSTGYQRSEFSGKSFQDLATGVPDAYSQHDFIRLGSWPDSRDAVAGTHAFDVIFLRFQAGSL